LLSIKNNDLQIALAPVSLKVKIVRLKIVTKDTWDIYAPVVGGGTNTMDCVEDFIGQHIQQHEAACSGLLALIEAAAEHPEGPKSLGNALCHYVSNPHEPKIYEFIKGRLRLLWFYGEGRRVIICAHGFFKASKKTPRCEVERALEIREQYLEAHNNNNIEILVEDGNEHS
jgi:hypothetical protein